jgi:hypothetical protein
VEFDWLSLCCALREKWFFIPINVGWDGTETWGPGREAGVDLDDLLLVFKHCRNAPSRREVQSETEAALRNSALGETAALFFREALEVGVYPKTVFLEDMPEPEYGWRIKRTVLHWVVDRVIEAGKKFPEAEVEALVLGVYFSPGPVLEQSEASMWDCCEYIRRLGNEDQARKEARNSVLSYCRVNPKRVTALLPTTVLDAFDILTGEATWLEVRNALFKTLVDGAPSTKQERVARLRESIPRRDVRLLPRAGAAAQGLSVILGMQTAAGASLDDVDDSEPTFMGELTVTVICLGVAWYVTAAFYEKYWKTDEGAAGAVLDDPAAAKDRREEIRRARRLPSFQMVSGYEGRTRFDRTSVGRRVAVPSEQSLPF